MGLGSDMMIAARLRRSPFASSRARRPRCAWFEPLEDRQLLVSDLVISEFLAKNDNGIVDKDADHSDWIEIHNTSAASVNLAGWSLTDDPADLDKWNFPVQQLPAGGYLVVFASEKNLAVAGSQLHTNFQLDAAGDFLALVEPGGVIASQFSPQYPPQRADISFGVAEKQVVTHLVASGATSKSLVPSSGALGQTWTGILANEPFNDASWLSGPTGVGYDTDPTGVGGSTGETIGPAPINRVLVDGAVGSIFVLDTDPFTQSGIVTTWSMFTNTPFNPDRMVTPLIFQKIGGTFKITGVGQTRTSNEAGLQSFPLDLQLGSAQVAGTDYYFGWKDGGNVTQNGGVIEYNDGADDVIRWFGGGHVGDLVVNQQFTGGQTFGRSYSLQATTSPTLADQIKTNVQTQMRGVNTSIYTRVPFQVTAPIDFDTLTLRMKYDDGFVAYLNGFEVARRNAPDPLGFNSSATINRSKTDAVSFESIDITAHLNRLRTGTNILAIHGLNDSLNSPEFLVLPELSGIKHLAPAGQYLLTPTPGTANGDGVVDFVEDTQFSVDRGFYSAPISAGIASATPGASIYYTTNGSIPGPTNAAATLYSGPITLSTTTTLRAVAYKTDYQPTKVDTQTYVFVASVANQPAAPPGLPLNWGPYTADYQVDPDVVNTTLPGYRLQDALLSIPTLSITTTPEDMFSASQGIYANNFQRGAAWEKRASIELINPNGTPGFHTDAGIRVVGNSSRDLGFTTKLSFRLMFRNEYGGDLNFPLYENYPVDKFEQLVLKASSTDSWPVVDGGSRWDNDRATYIRNSCMRDTQVAMGQGGTHGKYVNVYLNGLYWGQYDLLERPNDSFNSEQFGGDESEYDVLKDFGEVQAGDKTAWNAMMSLASGGLTSTAAYQRIQGNNPDGTPNPSFPKYLDVSNLTDYMILHIYSGAEDWPNHNWWAARRRDPAGGPKVSDGFRFFVWDQEISNDSLTRTTTLSEGPFASVASADSPAFLYSKLRFNTDFQLQFADRVHQLLFNGGVMTPAANDARWMGLAAQIDKSIVGESARWGDSKVAAPFKREVQWLNEMNWSHNTYWPQIHPIALQRFRSVGLYPNVTAPTFNQFGGQITPGFQLTMAAPAGTIYYRLDGLDPRMPDGSLRPQTLIYAGPVTLNSGLNVKARAQVGAAWSALDNATFSVNPPAAAGNLAITEINFNPAAPLTTELAINSALNNDDFEFVELMNVGNQTINLGGVHFSLGIDYTFADGVLAPGQRVLVVKNLAAFQLRYGAGANVAGVFEVDSNLSNNGETLTLLSATNGIIQSFTYRDSADWPARADGKGSSLVVVNTAAAYDNPTNWRSSTEFTGSPGTAGVGPAQGVVINEVLSHSTLPLIDGVELFNPTSGPIDIGGWYLSDSTSNYLKYRIPTSTILAAGAYLVFDESQFNPTPPGLNNFSLNGAHGDTLTLTTANASRPLLFMDDVQFDAAADGESFGRWPNGSGELYPQTSRTFGSANSGPRIGPVVISELMYHPNVVTDDLEFVELHNISASTVNLTSWKLDQGIDFSFASGTTIAPGGTLVVVRFDPNDPVNSGKLATFRSTYGITAAVALVGGYAGVLNDNGETVRLVRPDVAPPDEPTFTPYLLVDQVKYGDVAPWPTGPDGSGASLSRASNYALGSDATNWRSDLTSPGTIRASVADRRVFYNGSMFDGNDSAATAGDDGAIATDKQALLPGGTATFANYTSYSRGLNGLILDINNLLVAPTAGEFTLRMGNNNNPAGWAAVALPIVTVRRGEGINHSDRITLVWTDDVIRNKWLQVTLNPGGTGLTAPDVFYFGNAVAETGNLAGSATVNASDEVLARNNARTFTNPADVSFPYDFDRDGFVNAADQILARSNATALGSELSLIHPPMAFALSSSLAVTSSPASAQIIDEPDWAFGIALQSTEQDNGLLASAALTSQVFAAGQSLASRTLSTSPAPPLANSTSTLTTNTTAAVDSVLTDELFDLIADELITSFDL